jgi:hypothetical protein
MGFRGSEISRGGYIFIAAPPRARKGGVIVSRQCFTFCRITSIMRVPDVTKSMT